MDANKMGILPRATILAVGICALTLAICPAMAQNSELTSFKFPVTTQPADDIMAYVNGKPVSIKPLVDALLSGPGLAYAEQYIRAELIEQELAKNKIVVTEADLKAQYERFLVEMVPPGLKKEQREMVLKKLLADKQVSRSQWDLGVKLATGLRKLAEGKVKITAEMLRGEFDYQFGRQVIVRDIEVDSLVKTEMIFNKLDKGAKFAALAAEFSIAENAKRGGLLKPISSKDRVDSDIAPTIRQVALEMKKSGDISNPIQVGTTFHILKLVKVIPPKNARFEDVKDKMATSVREKLIRHYQGQILMQLMRNAKVEYVNPILKQQADQKNKKKGNTP